MRNEGGMLKHAERGEWHAKACGTGEWYAKACGTGLVQPITNPTIDFREGKALVLNWYEVVIPSIGSEE